MKYWIGTISAEHACNGKKEGIAQIGHGKRQGLERMKAGDWLVYYSPVVKMGDKKPYQCFTSIGRVGAGEIYQVEVSPTFKPFRRKVEYVESTDAPIRPLLEKLSFTAGKASWGAAFRFGLFSISEEDFKLIAEAMGAEVGHR